MRESFDNPEPGERERFEIGDPQSALGLKILAQSNASDDGSAGLKGYTVRGFSLEGRQLGQLSGDTGGTRQEARDR